MFKINYEKNNFKFKCLIKLNEFTIASSEAPSREGAFELAYRDVIKLIFKAKYMSL
jgi:hypothetical protein